MPFFAEHRLIMLENTGFLRAPARNWQIICPPCLRKPVMGGCLWRARWINGENCIRRKKPGRLWKLTHQNEKVLTSWILGLLQKEGVKITRSGLQLFLERTGMIWRELPGNWIS